MGISCVKVTVADCVILLMISAALLLNSLCLGVFFNLYYSPEVGLSQQSHSQSADVESEALRGWVTYTEPVTDKVRI